MIRALGIGFLLLAACLPGQAQTVYSFGVYSMGQVHEHNWTVGSGDARFGFDEFRQYQDASGKNLHAYSDVVTKGVTSPRYTTIYFGPVHFTVRGPAWLAAALTGLIIVSLVSLAIACGSGLRRPRQASA